MSDGGGNEANTHPNPDLNSTEDEDQSKSIEKL